MSSLGQLLANSNSLFDVTTSVVDLPITSAITPARHFISKRCLDHNLEILIRRFRGMPAMSENIGNRKSKTQITKSLITSILAIVRWGTKSLSCYEFDREIYQFKAALFRETKYRKLI